MTLVFANSSLITLAMVSYLCHFQEIMDCNLFGDMISNNLSSSAKSLHPVCRNISLTYGKQLHVCETIRRFNLFAFPMTFKVYSKQEFISLFSVQS